MSVADRRRRQNRRRAKQRAKADARAISVAGEADREPVFAPPRDTSPCPSCRERPRQGRDDIRRMHALRSMAFPLMPRGEIKCEECLGYGYLVRINGHLFPATADNRARADVFTDPYDLEAKESRDALDRLRLHRLRHRETWEKQDSLDALARWREKRP